MAFDTSVSGILAASSNLGIIGNNIANGSTVGFKSSTGEFKDIYSQSLSGSSIGQGVALTSIKQDFSQGNVTFTNNSLDLAINGEGFFALDDGGVQNYSRAGAFRLDQDGFIVNAAGLKLQGFPTDIDGTVTGEAGPLTLGNGLVPPNGTTVATLEANVDARALPPQAWNPDGAGGGLNAFGDPQVLPNTAQYNSATTLTIYDGLGNPHSLSLYLIKTDANNTWEAKVAIDGVEIDPVDAAGANVVANIPFQADGTIADVNKPLTINIAGWQPLNATGLENGAALQNFSIDVSSFSQYGAPFAVGAIQQDGYSTGQLRGLDIDDSGVLFTRYSNGQSRQQGLVAVANFSNPNGLVPIGDTAFAESFSSGTPILTAPGLSGTGTLQSGALESSNVEITAQLVAMMVAQRNFQSNAQMIQTQDAVTQTIINLR